MPTFDREMAKREGRRLAGYRVVWISGCLGARALLQWSGTGVNGEGTVEKRLSLEAERLNLHTITTPVNKCCPILCGA